MVLMNEWLPNPAGSDSAGEWVELFNSGNTTVDFSGWQIKTKGGSRATLSGQINSGGYLVLRRTKTKLVLKNSDEGLFLYDAEGKLIDQSAFKGSAPQGKSFSRFNGGSFSWAEPTPGGQNRVSLDMSVAKNDYPRGVPLNRPLGVQGIILLALGVAVVFAAMTIFVIKRNADLSKLFFGKN